MNSLPESGTEMSQLQVGTEVEVEVGPVAHGGHCVARHQGRVIFVRHSLPGERVRARITEVKKRFARADAIRIVTASPDRITPACEFSGPGRCGGCDFQHVELAGQRRLKAAVVAEQLQRVGRIDQLPHPIVVEPVPGDQTGLGWRTRMRYVRLDSDTLGLRQYRSREVVAIPHCVIEAADAIRIIEGESPSQSSVTETVTYNGQSQEFTVATDGFWQVHAGAPATLVDAVMAQLAPRRGDHILDLYAGAGLFSVFIAQAVGAAGWVGAVEGNAIAAQHGRANLAAFEQAHMMTGHIDGRLARRLPQRIRTGGVAAVVLDPPRSGAKEPVVAAVAQLHPSRVVYVACDPAALARDVAYFADCGYQLEQVRAFDIFPMTHHVECVALLRPNPV